MKGKIRRITLFVGLGLLAVVILQNLKNIQLKLLVWEVNAPLILFIPIIFLVGYGIGWFIKGHRKS
jgi:uncharacterized integral membrane protein